MRVYLAGKMRGIPEYNFPAFHKAAKELREAGFEVVSPAEMDLDLGFDPAKDPFTDKMFAAAMARDLAEVCMADGIVLMPGWWDSKGAFIERLVAGQMGKRIMGLEEALSSGPHDRGNQLVST